MEHIFQVLDHVPLGIFALRSDYRVVFWNSVLEDWTGISREEIIDKDIGDFYPHLYESRYTSRLEGIFEGGPPAVFSSQLHKHIIPSQSWNGEQHIQHTTVTAIEDSIDGYFALFAIQDVSDVTRWVHEARMMRDQAQRSEAELRALFIAMQDNITVLDGDGYCKKVVSNGEILPYTASGDITNKSVYEFLPAHLADYFMDKLHYALDKQKAIDFDYELTHNQHWFNVSFSPMQNNSVVCVVRDITEQKIVQKRDMDLILEREKSQLMADFLRSATHDFRTPLSILNTSIYLIQKSDELSTQEFRLDVIKEQVNRIGHLVEGLFTMSQLDTMEHLSIGQLHLDKIIYNLVSSIQHRAAAKKLDLRVNIVGNLPKINADEVELTRALKCILDNALSYTNEGYIEIKAHHDIEHIYIQVSDTGIGIPEEDLPHIFKRFYKADKARSSHLGGLGLGLAMVKKIIEEHYGEIKVESTIDAGSTFIILLPVDPSNVRTNLLGY